MSSEIEKALRKKIRGLIPTQSFIGKVLTVDEANYTCTVMPIDSEAEIFKVRLKATIDNLKKGVISIPAVDSFVIVGLLGNNENSAFVVWCSNIKKYYIVGDGGNTLEFKDDGTILINGDTCGGLVKVSDLVTRLNSIENTINAHLLKYNTHLHPGGTISGSTGVPNVIDTDTVTVTVNSNIENTKVKHGN